jgi:HAD superfamily hydrolase (TIGR01459 family)
VLHDGEKIFSDAEKVFEVLQKSKKKIFIISNSGKRSSDNIERMKKLGSNHILKTPMITSGDVCYELLINKKKPFQNIGNNYFVVATDYPLLDKTNYKKTTDLDKSDFLLLSSTTGFNDYENLKQIFDRAIQLKLPLVCSNPDILGVSGEKIHPSTGDLAIQYKKLGGIIHVIGKPGFEIFDFAFNQASSLKEKVLMVGDSLFNDIFGANQFEIDSLLITSGIHRKDFSSNRDFQEIIDNIYSAYQNTGNPTYILDKLK